MNEIKSKIVGWEIATNESVDVEVIAPITPTTEEILASMVKHKQEEAIVAKVIEQIAAKATLKRPLCLDGKRWRLKPPHNEHALYVQLYAIEYEGKKYPYEIFFNSKDPQHIEWTNALTLTISEAFRSAIVNGTSLSNLVGNLKDTVSLSGGYVSKVPEKPKFVNGLVSEIAYVIEAFSNECLKWNSEKEENDSYWEAVTSPQSSHEHLPNLEDLKGFKQELSAIETLRVCPDRTSLEKGAAKYKLANPCPECGSELAKVAGCDACTNCSYSRCG